jgi:hypothetical protein
VTLSPTKLLADECRESDTVASRSPQVDDTGELGRLAEIPRCATITFPPNWGGATITLDSTRWAATTDDLRVIAIMKRDLDDERAAVDACEARLTEALMTSSSSGGYLKPLLIGAGATVVGVAVGFIAGAVLL